MKNDFLGDPENEAASLSTFASRKTNKVDYYETGKYDRRKIQRNQNSKPNWA